MKVKEVDKIILRNDFIILLNKERNKKIKLLYNQQSTKLLLKINTYQKETENANNTNKNKDK